MSAKLLKSLAAGECTVTNVSNGEVVVYWRDERSKLQHHVIRSGSTIDLLEFAPIEQLRKSPNLKTMFNKGHLKIR